MATNPRPYNKKPKGWRLITVDGIDYWWLAKTAPYIKRVSDRKMINTWDHFVNKGWYSAMDHGDVRWTPKLIADTIREIF